MHYNMETKIDHVLPFFNVPLNSNVPHLHVTICYQETPIFWLTFWILTSSELMPLLDSKSPFWLFSSQFRPNPRERCFLAWTVAVSFGLRTFSSIFSWGMRTIPNFENFCTRETPPSTALRDLAHKPVVFVGILVLAFAVELAVRPWFRAMRKVWPQSSFEKKEFAKSWSGWEGHDFHVFWR